MSEREDHTQWQAERRASVTSATGNLALIETRWTGEAPDLDAEQQAASDTVTVTRIQRTNIETGEAEHGLRLWDADAPAIRAFDLSLIHI